jgi:hypothetical protein
LGLPAISAVAAPDKELTDWVAKEQVKDPTYLAEFSDVLGTLYARLFGQTFLLDGELGLEWEPLPQIATSLGVWLDIQSVYQTMTLGSSDPNFYKTLVEKAIVQEETYAEIGFVTPEGEHKKLMCLRGAYLTSLSTTLGRDLPNAEALGLGMTYASLRYKLAEIDATKFGEIAAL